MYSSASSICNSDTDSTARGCPVDFEDTNIIQEFVVESSEHLADIENQLLTIEAAGANIDVDLINTVFRGVHSIKGAAGFLALTSINELSHSLENVLNLMRERELVPTSATVDVMLRSADQLRNLIENVAESNNIDVSEYVAALNAIASGSSYVAPVVAVVKEVPLAALVGAEDSLAEAEALIAAMEAAGTTCVQGMNSKSQPKKPAKKAAPSKRKATPKSTQGKSASPKANPAQDHQDESVMTDFVIESLQRLQDIEQQLQTLNAGGEPKNVALLNTIFRAVHSINITAGFLKLDAIQALVQPTEAILDRIRANTLSLTPEVYAALSTACVRLRELFGDIESSNSQDVSEHVDSLNLIINSQAQTLSAATTTNESQSQAQPSISLNDDAMREFFVESYENIEQLERDLMSLENEPASEVLINSVFRSIHTIKGTAGFLGFGKLESLTHKAETLLGDVRSGKLAMSPEIGGALFTTVDKVREMLQAIEQVGHETQCGSESLANELTMLHENLTSNGVAKKKAPARKAAAKNSATTVTAKQSPAPMDAKKQAQTGAVNSVVTIPTAVEKTLPDPTRSPAPIKTGGMSETSAADSTIRVDVALLDKLMTGVGELVLARNQILQFANGNVDSALHRTSQRLNLITSELQESVMKTRMQPIGNVWSKFPRLVRDLAGICEKEVRIEMEGKETELDKTIIEAIKDPLTHLVRNTVDHGIERPEVRVQNGKLAEGCLTLRAYHEGGQVNIEICDDGAGINAEKIKAKALERGLMTQDQLAKLSDRDIGNLIFLPGFSTAEKVSNVSGRGVGMDVVKTNIEKIGGTVDLQSQPGKGTTIKIRIPLTLAIIPALIVTCDNSRYAIPQVNLLELLRLDGNQLKEIEWIHSSPVYRLRGRLLPLVYLRDQLKLENDPNADALNIVVLRADDRQFGLVVDRINDSEEIVVKPLSSQLKTIPVYSGTTIMGDGQVALILDIMGLAHTSNVISDAGKGPTSEFQERSQSSGSDRQSLLVAGVGSKHRFAVELGQVTRLEKIDASTIEVADGKEVVQYRGEILSLIRLSDVMGVPSSKASDDSLLNIIVYSEAGRTVGIVVDRIIDIVEQTVDITKSARSHGRTVSAVIDGQVTDLVDLPAIMSQCV